MKKHVVPMCLMDKRQICVKTKEEIIILYCTGNYVTNHKYRFCCEVKWNLGRSWLWFCKQDFYLIPQSILQFKS